MEMKEITVAEPVVLVDPPTGKEFDTWSTYTFLTKMVIGHKELGPGVEGAETVERVLHVFKKAEAGSKVKLLPSDHRKVCEVLKVSEWNQALGYQLLPIIRSFLNAETIKE